MPMMLRQILNWVPAKKKSVYLGIVYISIRSKQKPLNYQQILRKIKSPNESADCKSDQLNLFCLCGDYY